MQLNAPVPATNSPQVSVENIAVSDINDALSRSPCFALPYEFVVQWDSEPSKFPS